MERRLRDLTRTIPDETLRRHYWTDMETRLSALFGRLTADERKTFLKLSAV